MGKALIMVAGAAGLWFMSGGVAGAEPERLARRLGARGSDQEGRRHVPHADPPAAPAPRSF